MNGEIRQYRLGPDGHTYKWVRRGYYKRIKEAPGPAVPLLVTEIMLKVPGTQFYRRTHKAVLDVACPWCKAKPGEACLGVLREPVSLTHCSRRDEWKDFKRNQAKT